MSCEGGIGLSFSNWDAEWYLGKQIHRPGFHHDHHELLALVAPRAFLLIGGESADGAQSWPYMEAALPVWRLFGAEDRLGLLRHAHGPRFPAAGAGAGARLLVAGALAGGVSEACVGVWVRPGWQGRRGERARAEFEFEFEFI